MLRLRTAAVKKNNGTPITIFKLEVEPVAPPI